MSTEHTPAEMLAHHWCADQARGRHGILEFEPGERYRQVATERAERVIAALAKAGYAVVELPDIENPSPALIEAAYVTQDDLSTPPTWAIGAAAEIIQEYIDRQGQTRVHVLGHPNEAAANRAEAQP